MHNIILYVRTLRPYEVSYINDFIIKALPIHEQRQLVGNTLIIVGFSMVVISLYLKLYMYLRYER
jgi:hypothetical protein